MRIMTTLAAASALLATAGCDLLGNKDAASNTEANLADAVGRDEPARRCASSAVYDQVELELFRQAARIRGRDSGAFDRLAAYSIVRMERPLLRSEDEHLHAIACTGRLNLDLPPGVEVVGGRHTLTADIGYSIQPAADGSGEVVVLSGADAIVIPLATLARSAGPVSEPARAPAAASEEGPVEAAPAVRSPPAPPPTLPPAPQPRVQAPAPLPPRPEPVPDTVARPSFNCARASTRSERAVCSSSGLAALDRSMSSVYFSAVRDADEPTRRVLQATRNRFLAYRERCGSDACIADAYRGRIREIHDIAGR